MGTRYTHQIVDNPNGLMFGFGGAKRDRTADLLHAMQALSQLSYGPGETLLRRCRERNNSGASHFPQAICEEISSSNEIGLKDATSPPLCVVADKSDTRLC